jgi:hypothetical protein
MDSARDKFTKIIVEAEILCQLDFVDPKGYECWGCGIDMVPRSWKRENKIRANFAKHPNQSHKKDCDADAEEKIVEQGIGKKQSIRNILENTPGLSPSSLVLIEQREHIGISSDLDNKTTRSLANSNNRNQELNANTDKKSRRPANTIRPICRAFINFPHDRNMSLNIPGIKGDNYIKIFKKLSNNEIRVYPETKIFYSSLLLWSEINHNDDLLIIPLTAGTWLHNKPDCTYKIYVDWSAWSKNKKTRLSNEIEIAQQEVRQLKEKNDKDRAWIFCIGKQDKEDLAIFHVNDIRLICSIIGHIIYPTFD